MFTTVSNSFLATGASPALSNMSIAKREVPPPAYTAPASSPQTKTEKTPIQVVKALYDFASEDSDDLNFKVGDVIEVLDSSDQYGWWNGRIKGTQRTGNFPSNYVKKL